MNYEDAIESQKGVLAGDPVSKMKKKQGYRVLPFTMNRRMVAASATVGREQNNIQAIIEVDISEPRRFIREYRQRTGERLSLTAYVAACLARAIAEYPNLNAFRKGRNLILLDDLTISVMVEREIDGEWDVRQQEPGRLGYSDRWWGHRCGRRGRDCREALCERWAARSTRAPVLDRHLQPRYR